MTDYLVVCPDTYEFINPAQMYTDPAAAAKADLETTMTGLPRAMQAMTVLTMASTFDTYGDGLDVQGRWFNKRVAILSPTSGLYKKLKAQADAEEAELRLRASMAMPTGPIAVEAEDTSGVDEFLLDSIMDAVKLPEFEEGDEDALDRETEATAEATVIQNEYTNISNLVRDHLLANVVVPESDAEEAEAVAALSKGTEKAKALHAARMAAVETMKVHAKEAAQALKDMKEAAASGTAPLDGPGTVKSLKSILSKATAITAVMDDEEDDEADDSSADGLDLGALIDEARA